MSGAKFEGADLTRADLLGARLANTGVYSFTLGRAFGFAHFGDQYDEGSYVRIGCKGYSLDYWLEYYEDIGFKYHYSPAEIKRYGAMLNLLTETTGA